MIVLAVAVVLVAALQAVLFERALATERARVNDLLLLLESKAAPAETAAYVAGYRDDRPPVEWRFSDDGLIAVEVPSG